MLKTVKGKVIAGTVAVTLFAGAGAAFGASDAGANLKTWYTAQFNKTAIEVAADSALYSGSKAKGLLNEYNTLREGAASEIDTSKTTNTNNSKTDIENAVAEHITSVEFSQAEINKYMEGQFNVISKAASDAMNNTADGITDFTTKDLTKLTGEKGKSALAHVNTELGQSKTDATAALNTAIKNAKDDLTAKLATEKGATTTEIKKMIDDKIIELRGKITEKKAELVAVQTGLIESKAAELEKAAIDELDAIVKAINKK